MIELPNELAPCGIYCGACPSFNKSCLGCANQRKDQKRKSKWGCKIRVCCFEQKQTICADCDEFLCSIHRKKLTDTHPGDPRFTYRHEIPAGLQRLNDIGMTAFLAFQEQRWTCPYCKNRVWFYHYRCSNCGQEVTIETI